jgi:4a-hydroxytetrahydrobiopterin dehydratase
MTSNDLAEKTCVPCKSGVPPIKGAALAELVAKLGGDWNVVSEHHLEKAYVFNNFRGALDFTNTAGAIAEEQGHHPEITLEWGRAAVRTWTHKIDGLTESDFILAAKLDKAYEAKRASLSTTPAGQPTPHI